MSAEEPLMPNGGNQNEDRPLLPLDKEVMIEVLQPVSSAAFVGIATSLAQAGQGLPDDLNTHVRAFLTVLLYGYFPLGLASLIAAVAVKQRPQLVGWASGWLLTEFYFVILIGGIVSVVKSGTNVWVMMVVIALLLAITTLIWCHCCSYPKCLRRLACCGRTRTNEDEPSPRQQRGRTSATDVVELLLPEHEEIKQPEPGAGVKQLAGGLQTS